MSKSNKPRSHRQRKAARRAAADALRTSVTYAVAKPGDDDAMPDDIDVFRLALARRILTFLGMPRRCRERVCRRTKLCAGPDMRCQRDFPAPKVTPEQDARVRADLYYAIKRRLAKDAQP